MSAGTLKVVAMRDASAAHNECCIAAAASCDVFLSATDTATLDVGGFAAEYPIRQ